LVTALSFKPHKTCHQSNTALTKVIFTLKHLQAIDYSAKNKRMDDQSSTQPKGSKMKKINSKPTRFKRNVLTLIFATAIGASNTVIAEEELIGSDEFRNSCASCHGVGGRGDGHLAQFLTVKPTDLTTLAKNNDGVYPFLRVFQIVDGRSQVSGHGERAMPVWGDRYKLENAEAYTRARILELVYYIQNIQQ
jgi:mono/diheme cytochrome c family protein